MQNIIVTVTHNLISQQQKNLHFLHAPSSIHIYAAQISPMMFFSLSFHHSPENIILEWLEG